MIIGIDGNEANIPNKVGVGQYAFKLLWHLYQLDNKNTYYIYLKEEPLSDLPKPRKNWQYKVFGPAKLWTRIALPFHLYTQKEKLNLFFSPSHYSPSISPFPTIPTIHDIGYLQFQNQFTKKDLYQLINWTKESLKKSSQIITVSQFSQNEIIKTYNINPNKIHIAYNGVDTPPKIDSKTQQDILSSYNLQPNNYYLYLGTLKPNKNIPFLIESYSLFLEKYKITPCPVKVHRYPGEGRKVGEAFPPKLVIAGKKGWLFEEIFATVKKYQIEEHVVFTDFVTENQKWTLYQNAVASVLPSTYEGFGIPAIESMKVGTPVIVSDIPPFREVVQNCGLFINPSDTNDLCQKMIEIKNPKIRQELSKLGITQADKFSWDSTAKSVLQVFQKIRLNRSKFGMK
ncbi:MAG: glycosyltransferase family 4 protein [Candidatus Shapirobacteria bacterium]|nr:glycosyltransferase family 4 protein [Candidatus Shapirobacteria bacterium]